MRSPERHSAPPRRGAESDHGPADPDRRVIVNCDGAARGNPGPAGIGVAITDGRGKVLTEIAEGIGVATNNVAEYRAAITGLAKAKELGATDVTLRSDSRLLIEQLSGRFRVKHPTLIRLSQEARRLLAEFPHVKLEHVPREQNKHADRLANAGVAPSTSDRTAAISEFGSASTSAETAARARALRRVAENSTLAQQEFNRAFVLMQYFGYLRRNPNDPPEPTLDFQGYNFWLNKLNTFNGNFVQAEMVKAFLNSTEYRQRFGQP